IDHIIDVGQALVIALNELKERDDIPMSRQQAAVYLGVSVSTISNYQLTGRLEKKVKNGIVGYMPADLRRIKNHGTQ
ncbi:hypothetical protein RCJ22_06200, partial [Vibrio sp. FNV 38]|nr:hypothetical protein [Vibrio sp. FNV 38]